MKKETKNINARYTEGNWVVRDNGEIIAKGNGLNNYIEAIKEIKKTAKKPVKETIQYI